LKNSLFAAIHGTFWLILFFASAGLIASLLLPQLDEKKSLNKG